MTSMNMEIASVTKNGPANVRILKTYSRFNRNYFLLLKDKKTNLIEVLNLLLMRLKHVLNREFVVPTTWLLLQPRLLQRNR